MICNEIEAEQLRNALALAIKTQEAHERSIGYTSDSGMLAAWREMAQSIQVMRFTSVDPPNDGAVVISWNAQWREF
jgi:hypothetical protein